MNETKNFPLTPAEAEELFELLREAADRSEANAERLLNATNSRQAGFNALDRVTELRELADRLESAFPFDDEE
jgi:hypothetical protein